VACPFLLLTASTHSFPLAIPGLLLFGLARGIFDANHMPILRQIVDERLSATAYGFLNFQSCAAGGLLIYAGGLLNDARFGLGVVFQAVALSLLLLGALLLLLKPAPAHPAVPAPPQREPVLS
jgi:hypothetical protein